jgi:hypothetical protein
MQVTNQGRSSKQRLAIRRVGMQTSINSVTNGVLRAVVACLNHELLMNHWLSHVVISSPFLRLHDRLDVHILQRYALEN